MKKLFFFISLSLCLVGSSMAQSALYHKSKKLKPSEVPVTVLKAFTTDFQNMDFNKGSWSVLYLEEPDQVQSIRRFEPIYYSFVSRKKGSDNIEIKFTPQGKLESVHGIEDPTTSSPMQE